MSDPSNLDNFFAQNKKKKGAKKTAATKKTPAAAPEQTRAEEEVKADPASAQPEPVAAVAGPDFGDSSDEESNTIVINDRQKIVDRKDLEASKKNKAEDANDSVAGWGLGTKFGQVDNTPLYQPSMASAAKSTGATGPKMNFGRPMFTSNKRKGVMDNSDFPDLDSTAQAQAQATAGTTDGP
jgi:hypothetical protein